MHTQQAQKEPDELRARFTRWIEVLVYRARNKYLQKEANRIKTISLEDLPEDQWPVAPPQVPLKPKFPRELYYTAHRAAGSRDRRERISLSVFEGGLSRRQPLGESEEIINLALSNSNSSFLNVKLCSSRKPSTA